MCFEIEIFKGEKGSTIVCVVVVTCTCFSLQDIYNMMTKDYGIPEWACYVIFAIATILLGLILGLVSVYVWYLVLPTKNVHFAFYSLWPVLKSTKLYYVLFLSPPKIKDYGLNVFVLFVFLSSKAEMLHQYSIFRAFLEHLFWNMILLFKDRVMLFLIDLIWFLCIFFPKIEIQFFH